MRFNQLLKRFSAFPGLQLFLSIHGLGSSFKPLRINQIPGSLKAFCRFGTGVLRIIMLSDAAGEVVSGANVVAACGFALEDVGPKFHDKEKARKSWPVIFWLPGTDSNCRLSG